MVDEIASTCEAIRKKASHPEAWGMASRIVRVALQDGSTCEDLLELARKAQKEDMQCLAALAYFGIAALADARLEDVAVSQALASQYLYVRTADDEFLLTVTLVEFLEAFWHHALEKQAFRFTAPATARASFTRAVQKEASSRAQAILVVALTYLRARLPEEARDVRDWLRG
jgi:hypothetical protein